MGSGSFPGVKRQIRGVNHPHHPAQKLKKTRDIIILLLWDFIGCCWVNSSFYLYYSSASNYKQCDSPKLEIGYKKKSTLTKPIIKSAVQKFRAPGHWGEYIL